MPTYRTHLDDTAIAILAHNLTTSLQVYAATSRQPPYASAWVDLDPPDHPAMRTLMICTAVDRDTVATFATTNTREVHTPGAHLQTMRWQLFQPHVGGNYHQTLQRRPNPRDNSHLPHDERDNELIRYPDQGWVRDMWSYDVAAYGGMRKIIREALAHVPMMR